MHTYTTHTHIYIYIYYIIQSRVSRDCLNSSPVSFLPSAILKRRQNRKCAKSVKTINTNRVCSSQDHKKPFSNSLFFYFCLLVKLG